MKVLSKKFLVTNNSYDLYGKLKLEALLDMFETVASMHDKESEIYRLAEGNIWIVNQTKLSFRKHVKLDEFTVETYYNKPNRFDIIRNYLLKNDDEILATGASKWLVVSRETSSFVSLAKFLNGEAEYLEEEIYPYKSFRKIKPFDFELDLFGSFKVNVMDLDMNVHLNNTRYLYHLMNIIRLEKDDYLKELDMCYLKEIKLDSIVEVYGKRIDKEIFLEIRSDEEIHSRLKITLY